MTTREEAYTLEICERGKRLSKEPMPDPFHNTTIHVRGWRNALSVLRRRYTVCVHVGGNGDRVEDVLALNPDHLRPGEAPSFIDGKLHDFAARLAEHDVPEPGDPS
jgi:hypothetical protein